MSNNIKKLWLGFIIVLALLFFSDIIIHRHSYFEIDGFFAFPSLYGFLSCVFLVFLSKLIGIFLKRPEDYYDN
ncbi:MAG: hypothetical protein ISQ22_06295 [Rhizobiales bacterium]|jgi:UPF0716 family protein affecting phage T7 exclusion|nr:hypothetical protein [Hyphomicrobiales bacterium]